jgi:transcriptional regulator with XRE-family HTH domain
MAELAGDIGTRAAIIRRNRGQTQQVVAELCGISQPYLSQLENGSRAFVRRGLVEDLADALGVSPRDLTGTPVTSPDRRSLQAASAVPGLVTALHDTALDDPLDGPARPLAQLVDMVDIANYQADQVSFELVSGATMGELVNELHVHAANPNTEVKRKALEALVTACVVARSLAWALGEDQLAATATRRGWDAAHMLGDPHLVGLMAMGRTVSLIRLGSRKRAGVVLGRALTDVQDGTGPVAEDTTAAEVRGMLHLTQAHLSAREGRCDDADLHIQEARDLARHTGERNYMRYHFGPSNVAAWDLAAAVETNRGPEAAERLAPVLEMAKFESKDRVGAVHFDLARAYAQAEGQRDDDALRHIDLADRAAPVRMRQDPLAKDLIRDLDRRARRRQWILDSMKNRFGVA